MALNDMLAAMDAQAGAEIKQIAAHAEQQAVAIEQEAEQQAQLFHTRFEAEQHTPLERERARRLNQARRDALNAAGHASERLYSAAIGQTHARLHTLRDAPQYPAVLRALVMEAISALGGSVVLRADPRDTALLHDIVPNVPLEWDLETAGGVEARSADGRIVVTNTLEARLSQAESTIRQAVMSLFERTQPWENGATSTPASAQ